MKLQLFSYIDQVIEYKESLRFELEEAQKAIDDLFTSIFSSKDWFVNYSSRIKEDDSLKEKIIRQDYFRRYREPQAMFHQLSDIIGSRIECRFINDEEVAYQALFKHFPYPNNGGFYRSDRDPRIELRLGDDQPKQQKNGFSSYRIDGRFLGRTVLNFELQIKSIVNVFWNEIDHKILYKNYNYVVTEAFVRQIMASIKGDLELIDRQLQMVYEHLTSLDQAGSWSPNQQLESFIGRTIQDIYVMPLRESSNLFFDFRASTDLLTEFLFTRVKYESKEGMASEFIRILEEASRAKLDEVRFGYTLDFDPPIDYHSDITREMGDLINKAVNENLAWNFMVAILFDLNPDQKQREIFRTFVDYIYFRIIHCVRSTFEEEGASPADHEGIIDEISMFYIRYSMVYPDAIYFTLEGLEDFKKVLRHMIDVWLTQGDSEAVFQVFTEAYASQEIEGRLGEVEDLQAPQEKGGRDYGHND